MKKWLNFFFLGFFSHKTAKEGVRRGYANVFLGFMLVLVLLWASFTLGDMLPFGVHYNNSPDFKATVHALLSDAESRINAEIKDGDLTLENDRLINTLESEADRQTYGAKGYQVVVDMRPADTLAEVEAYCLSNDGNNTEISYEDYLTLSSVARLNFDFKLRYTGRELVLDDSTVEDYAAYLVSLGGEAKDGAEQLKGNLEAEKITKTEYNREIYKLYFTNYYPDIGAYESTSEIPLLRNYYYHQYISQGTKNYLFVFDDYMTGSFETRGGVEVPFYGFFSSLEEGPLVKSGASQEEAGRLADSFIKDSFRANWFLNAYAYVINIITLAPFIALMLMVAALLCYSILKLSGVESIKSLGAMLKIVGSFSWFCGLASAVVSVIMAFFVKRGLMGVLPLVMFFLVLVVRSVIFVIEEKRLCAKQSEKTAASGGLNC